MFKSRAVLVSVVVLAFIFGGGAVSNAQTLAPGVVLGVNSSILAGPSVKEASRLLGLSVGPSIAVGLTENVGLDAGLLFSQKGFSLVDGKDKAKARINYIDVPVLLRAGAGAGKSTGVYGLLGPVLSVKMGSSATINGKSDSTWDDTDVKGTDFSGLVGVGVVVRSVEASIRYTFGLRSIDATSDPNDVKNRTFSFLVGVRFK